MQNIMQMISALCRWFKMTQKRAVGRIILIMLAIFTWYEFTKWSADLRPHGSTNDEEISGGLSQNQIKSHITLSRSLLYDNCSNFTEGRNINKEITKKYSLPELRAGYLEEPSCGTIWIGSDDLTLSEKLKLYSAVVDFIGKMYLLKESSWKHFDEKVLRRYIKTVKVGNKGILKTLEVFEMLSDSEFVFSVFVKPDLDIPNKESDDYGMTSFSDDFYISSYYQCTATGLTLEMSAMPEERSCFPDINRHKFPRKSMDPKLFTYHGWSFDPVPYVDDDVRGLHPDDPKREWSLSCPKCHQIPKFLTFMHIVRNAIVVDSGVIYQIDDGLKIVPVSCRIRGEVLPHVTLQQISNRPSYRVSSQDAVFVVDSCLQGDEEDYDYYHTFVESFTKLSLNLDFLKSNPQVTIHVTGSFSAKVMRRKFLQLFDLKNKVTSGLVHAKVVYVPEGIPCFKPPFLYLQASQKQLRNNLKLNNYKQDSILYIQQENCRSLEENEQVQQLLRDIADRYDLKLQSYNPDDNLSINQTAKLFFSSVLVLSVHGEALSNILFSKPGTAVFEITTYFSTANYMHMSHKLGLRYHAFYAKKPGKEKCDVVKIGGDWNSFAHSVEQLLQYVFHSAISN